MENLRKVLKKLESALIEEEGIADEGLFTTLVNESMEALRLEDSDIAGKMSVSRSAISRWRRGLDAPLPMMRKNIYRFFAKKIIELWGITLQKNKKFLTHQFVFDIIVTDILERGVPAGDDVGHDVRGSVSALWVNDPIVPELQKCYDDTLSECRRFGRFLIWTTLFYTRASKVAAKHKLSTRATDLVYVDSLLGWAESTKTTA